MTHYQTYLKNRLKAFAYPAEDLELMECSGFSQGDGIAWYGVLDTEALRALAQRYLQGGEGDTPAQSAYQRLAARIRGKNLFELFDLYESHTLEFSLDISRRGDGRYHHWNSMELDFVDGARDLDELQEMVEEESSEPELHRGHWDAYQKAWKGFYAWLADDLKQTSRKIEEELQNIKLAEFVEGAEVWSFETARYRFELHELSDELSDSPLDHWDEGAVMDFLTVLARSEGRVTNLKAVVLDRETGDELGSDSLWYWYVPNTEKGKGFNQGRLMVFTDLLGEVRRKVAFSAEEDLDEAA